ncbi:poly(A)-specific ribonuclease [Coemansia sp. RSA 1722]|nr:poly(A)-specific ribonuclease [Coemansia sp. RSA 485]KAJ2604881.1 poly(A)-specific ribonuclease [Coemansia sp. RSA 1722]
MAQVVWSEYTQSWDSSDESQAAWPILSLATGSNSELIYTGDTSGRLTTYTLGDYGEPLQRHTSFVCARAPIRQLHSIPSPNATDLVLVQTDDMIQVRTGGGRKVFGKSTILNEAFTASSVCPDGSEAYVVTSAGAGTILNLNAGGSVVKRINMEASTVKMCFYDKMLVSATAQGMLNCRDIRAQTYNTVVQSVAAFDSAVSDMVCADNEIFVCGSMTDPSNAYKVVADSKVKVFDMRKLAEPTSVIDLGEDVIPVKLWFAKNSLWVCHDSGYVESRMRGVSGTDEKWQTLGSGYAEPALSDYAYASAFCVAPSGSVALIADTDGILHVWGEEEPHKQPQISESGNMPDIFANDSDTHIGVDFDDESISLSAISLGPVNEQLLSGMYDGHLYDVGRPVNFVDPNTTGHLRQMDNVGYMFNPRSGKRNQQVFGRGWRNRWREGVQNGQDDAELTMGRSKFLSQQQRQRDHPSRHGSPRPDSTQPGARGSSSPALQSAALASAMGSANTSAAAAAAADMSTATASAAAAATATGAASSESQISGGKAAPPKQLQRMRIEYSRFGVEDFDFSLYNSTKHSGLEGDIVNSYANALLQMLFYCAEFRAVALSHCATDCSEKSCLSCQLGFLFRMLETASGVSCNATQLLHVLADRPEAAALALLEDENGNPANGASYVVLIQRLLRFVLEQASAECAPLTFDRNRIVEQTIGFTQHVRTTCPQCRGTQTRSSHAFAADMDPPYGTSGLATLLAGGSVSVRRAEMMRSGKRIGIHDLIAQSLSKCETTRAWCAECRKFQLLQTEKHMVSAPEGYLAFNFPVVDSMSSGANNSSSLGVAASTGTSTAVTASASASAAGGGMDAGGQISSPWQLSLPTEFRLVIREPTKASASSSYPGSSISNPRVQVLPAKNEEKQEDSEENDGLETGACSTFNLVAVVSGIRDTPRGAEHLVVHVRDPSTPGGWLLFNDFLVQPVSEDRVVGLFDWWRVPSLAIYANSDRVSLTQSIDTVTRQFPYKISTRILTMPKSILDRPSSHRRGNNAGNKAASRVARSVNKRNEAIPLTKAEAELLESGRFRCAFDAEFVVLETAKMEVFSDGTQELHKPPIHTLARLSVIRANGGHLHGMPFIDDYVAITRPIADLATQYSGIHAGDLEIGSSPYKLSTMKEAYKKLRLLVDSRCTIIGHGLKHDFRICNIYVPPELQRDTMVLFQTPEFIRPIALRFLYWFFYRKTIQSSEHSSVEDAQATLKVFESYMKTIDDDPNHSVDSVLDVIYSIGQQLAWKVPE